MTTSDARGNAARLALTSAALRSLDLLGLSVDDATRALRIDRTNLSQLSVGTAVLEEGSEQWSAALTIVAVARALASALGSDSVQLSDWMRSFNRALNDTPAQVITQPGGADKILNYLQSARAGDFT